MERKLSNRLCALRKAHGFTQQQVADHLGVDRSTLAYYESGRTSAPLRALKKLRSLYHITYGDLLEDGDMMEVLAETEMTLLQAYRNASSKVRQHCEAVLRDEHS